MSKLSKPNGGLEEARPMAGMSPVNANAAGVDIGASLTGTGLVCADSTPALPPLQ